VVSDEEIIELSLKIVREAERTGVPVTELWRRIIRLGWDCHWECVQMGEDV
jgi:hypothetical protein